MLTINCTTDELAKALADQLYVSMLLSRDIAADLDAGEARNSAHTSAIEEIAEVKALSFVARLHLEGVLHDRG